MNSQHIPNMVVGIQTFGDRIVVSDVQESVHFVKYRPAENQLVIFADDLDCTIVRKTLVELKEAMIFNFSKIEDFCVKNRLKLNSSKSHFMVIATE